jgi:hypothetical protein
VIQQSHGAVAVKFGRVKALAISATELDSWLRGLDVKNVADAETLTHFVDNLVPVLLAQSVSLKVQAEEERAAEAVKRDRVALINMDLGPTDYFRRDASLIRSVRPLTPDEIKWCTRHGSVQMGWMVSAGVTMDDSPAEPKFIGTTLWLKKQDEKSPNYQDKLLREMMEISNRKMLVGPQIAEVFPERYVRRKMPGQEFVVQHPTDHNPDAGWSVWIPEHMERWEWEEPFIQEYLRTASHEQLYSAQYSTEPPVRASKRQRIADGVPIQPSSVQPAGAGVPRNGDDEAAAQARPAASGHLVGAS